MSRNFELFHQLDLERRNRVPASELPPPQVVRAANPRLHAGSLARVEIGKLVQRLFLGPGEPAPRAVLFTAVDEDPSPGLVCSHAADLLASHISGSVCLVDANLRAPSLHELFGVRNGKGLTDLAIEGAGVHEYTVQLPSSGNLWLLTAGTPMPDCDDIVNSERMRARMAEIRVYFDYVLVQAPPAGLFPDSVNLAALADGVVLVLQANATRREAARRAKDDLQAAGVPVLGAVLNDRTFPIPAAIYSRL